MNRSAAPFCLLGARNQAFLTEYVAGMETVKSLQMEPQLQGRFGDYLASYMKAGFELFAEQRSDDWPREIGCPGTEMLLQPL